MNNITTEIETAITATDDSKLNVTNGVWVGELSSTSGTNKISLSNGAITTIKAGGAVELSGRTVYLGSGTAAGGTADMVSMLSRSGDDLNVGAGLDPTDTVNISGQVVIGENLTCGLIHGTLLRSRGLSTVTGESASTVYMTLAAAITSSAATLQTNDFAVVFEAAPIVTVAYAEDPGSAEAPWVVSVTPSNLVVTVVADKDFNYIAHGQSPTP
jgi:hypothetical protein